MASDASARKSARARLRAHVRGAVLFGHHSEGSTRGKLRNQLVPLLEDMFGEGCATCPAWARIRRSSVASSRRAMRPFDERVHMSDAGAYVNLEGFEDQPMLFWKEAMKRVCHGLGSGMMTESPCASSSTASPRTACDATPRRMDHAQEAEQDFVVGKTLAMFASEFYPSGPDARAAGARRPLGARARGATLTSSARWTITAREVANDGREGPGFVARRIHATPLDAWAVLRNESRTTSRGGRTSCRPGRASPRVSEAWTRSSRAPCPS